MTSSASPAGETKHVTATSRWTSLHTIQESATAPPSMPLTALLEDVGRQDVDALRAIREHSVHALIEVEAAAVIGADRHERALERQTYRHSHRARLWDLLAGRLEREIPTLRQRRFNTLAGHRDSFVKVSR